jgi:hypothetical protein
MSVDNVGDFEIFVVIKRYVLSDLMGSARIEHGEILKISRFERRTRPSRETTTR